MKALLTALLATTLLSAQQADTTTAQAKAKPKSRIIQLTSVITAPDILYDANSLYELAKESTSPVDIVLNSPGGGVFAGLQFINAMEAVKSRGVTLRCHVAGMAASMAFQILAHCDERYGLRYSLLLWHPVRVAGMMLLTPASAEYLAHSLQRIEDLMVPVLLDKLKIDEDTFYFHYHNETMWTAEEVSKLAPGFIEIVDDMPIAGSIWNPQRMRGEVEKSGHGEVQWPEFEIGDTDVSPGSQSRSRRENVTPLSPAPAPEAPKDCTSCHKPHDKRKGK